MIELLMQLKCHFTDAEKEKCVPTIHQLIELSNRARMNGILELEQEAHQTPCLFLKTALNLVADGTDPSTVKQILYNLILADKYSGSQLLDRLLMAEGVLALQQGENPRIIVIKLNSIMGEKYIPAGDEEPFTMNEKMKKYTAFLKTLHNKAPLPGSVSFESIFLNLDNRSLQHLIHNVDIQELSQAIHGCGFKLTYKVFENVSMNVCLQICENIELYKHLCSEYIFAAQKRITNVYETLLNRGEIISSDLYKQLTSSV